jgi:hypothetical protein
MSSRPDSALLERYLDRICRRLWFVTPRERRETREELRQHLETLAAHAARRVGAKQAMEEAMEKFGDPKQIAKDLSRQHLRRRRWLRILLKTAGGLALTLLIGALGYSAYWYFALSKPVEQEAALIPVSSASSTLAAIETVQDGYARQIQSMRFQSEQGVHTYYQGHADRTVPHIYQVAAKGDRYYSRDISDDRYGQAPNEALHIDDVYISDGKTMRENLVDWNGTASRHSLGERHGGIAYLRDNNFKPHDPDAVLKYGYKVHGAWIGDMLRRGKPSLEGMVMDARFGPLTVVRCRSKASWGSPEEVRLWLAPKFGWLAVKTETRESNARPPFAQQMVYETEKLVRSGSRWVASEGKMRFAALGLGRQQALGNTSEHFTNIVFNDVPDSRFILHDPVGTQVLSVDFQNTFVLQPSGQWKKEPSEHASSFLSVLFYPLMECIVLVVGVGLVVITRKRQKRRLTA